MALVDSNDSNDLRSSEIFLRKYFIRKNIKHKENKPNFDFIMISHWHDDHIKGIQQIIEEFGTKRIFYPKTKKSELMTITKESFDYENEKLSYDMQHQSIDNTKKMRDFGDIKMEILWPPQSFNSYENENNNSIVLKMTLNNVNYILTGDAEAKVWKNIAKDIPTDTKFFKVPHHGSINGTIVNNNTPWLNRLNSWVSLGISGHARGVNWQIFPRKEVIDEFIKKQRDYYRTDNQYHLTFSTNGSNNQKVKVKYSHIN